MENKYYPQSLPGDNPLCTIRESALSTSVGHKRELLYNLGLLTEQHFKNVFEVHFVSQDIDWEKSSEVSATGALTRIPPWEIRAAPGCHSTS